MKPLLKKPYLKTVLALFLMLSLLLGGCNLSGTNEPSQTEAQNIDAEGTSGRTSYEWGELNQEPLKVRFFAAGDNLIHSSLYNQAKARATDGGYDFYYAYQHVKGIIPDEGIRLLNQETLIANDIYPPSSYPMFNSPTQLGDTMLDIGFNAFNLANNHTLDKGVKGMLATLDYWESRNALVCGAYRNEAHMQNIPTMEVDGLKFSFLGFTEHTNGLSIPSDSEIKIIYTANLQAMEEQITAASAISDVVVVSVHWGVENSNTVTDAQKNLARQMSEWGAHVIIGTHPHTIQTLETFENSRGEQTFVAYSLGNFISAQNIKHLMVGMAVDFDVIKEPATGKISFSEIKSIPIITHYESGYRNVRSYPYSQYSPELAASHGVSGISIDYIDGLIDSVLPTEDLIIVR